MANKTKAQLETEATLLAARNFSRRVMLKRSAAAGAVLAAGPWIVKDAFSTSGEINILNWADEVMDPVLPNFTAKTGIKVNSTPFSQNEEQINKLQATAVRA
jgi:spermidine/putrescine transport system substrate-binding protein